MSNKLQTVSYGQLQEAPAAALVTPNVGSVLRNRKSGGTPDECVTLAIQFILVFIEVELNRFFLCSRAEPEQYHVSTVVPLFHDSPGEQVCGMQTFPLFLFISFEYEFCIHLFVFHYSNLNCLPLSDESSVSFSRGHEP